MERNKTKIDEALRSVVNIKLVDPFGKHIVGLPYQVRQGTQVVARGVTNNDGKFSSFASIIGTILTVYVERFGTNEFKEIKKIIPWSEDFRIKLVSEKRKEKLHAQEHEGNPGNYQRKTYKVCKDDTLGRIAGRYDTTAAELAALNGIKVTDTIYVDQVLKVPNKRGQAPAAAPAPATRSPATASPSGQESPSECKQSAVPANGQETPGASAPSPAHTPIKETAPASVPPTTDMDGPSNNSESAETVPSKVSPITTPIPIVKEEDRGPNGTPKTSISPVCDQSGCIKLGDRGPLVEELNLRLIGFGNTIHAPAALDEFTVATEKAVKQFQRDYMGKEATGKVCGSVLAALDDFLIKFPIAFSPLACQCRAHGATAAQGCSGYGSARVASASVNHLQNGVSVPGVERPGIHRALFWSLRAGLFYLKEKESQLGYEFSHIASGYRCWMRAKQKNLWTTNHLGNACDVHFKRKSNGSHVDGNALETLKEKVFVARMRARPTWDTPNRISLEPKNLTDQWVHMDVREFQAQYKLDRYYAKDRTAADGDPMTTIARREGRLGLVNCGGIASNPASVTETAATSPASQQVADQPAPKPAAKPAPAATQKSGTKAGKGSPVSVGPASTGRKDPQTLHVSQLGLDS